MKRREAIAAVAVAMVGLMSGKAKSEPAATSGSNVPLTLPGPPAITLDLDGFKSFTFGHNGKTVTFSPLEIFDALKGG